MDAQTLVIAKVAIAEIEGSGPSSADDAFLQIQKRLNELIKQALDEMNMVPELLDALERFVKLQSHYAGLLNMRDGGERLTFDGADDWLQRLRSLKSH